MSSLAVLIGVSDYQQPNMCLNACKTDVSLMHKLIEGTGKFSDILFLDTNTQSAEVKTKLVDFVTTNKETEVDEVFFYFSGHGDYSGDEFYFLLSDYDQKRKSQTCLTNSELDALLRGLKPKLTVKVVDACHAGVQYIKDASSIKEYFTKSSTGIFNKCYFMFSSQADQVSWADSNISHFTKAFVDAVATYPGASIRYKDIIDNISDYFFSASIQTPYFVTQADFTEIFGSISETLKQNLKSPLDFSSPSSSGTGKSSLVELVRHHAAEYCGRDEAVLVLERVKQDFVNYNFPQEILDIFDLKIVFVDSYAGVPKLSDIGMWLSKNKNSFFASVSKRQEEYEDYLSPVDAVRASLGNLYGARKQDDGEKVKLTRDVITGFGITVDDLPYKLVKIDLISKFENIESYNMSLVFLLSKTQIKFFYFFTNYFEKTWDHLTLNKAIEWRSSEARLKDVDQVSSCAIQLLNEFEEWVVNSVQDAINIGSRLPESGGKHPE